MAKFRYSLQNILNIKEKMEKFGVICGQIRAEITV